jgi:protein-S-isoprenylcysteine O-methyltransferase Ste14
MAASPATEIRREDSPGVVIVPPAVFLTCLVCGAALSLWEGWYGWSLPLIIAGLATGVAGFAFMGWGHGRFKSLGVNVKTSLPASQLVTKGAYGISRNPMYVGFVAILAGLGIANGSVPMLLSAVSMFVYLDWYVIPREEKYLARTFGDEYKAYCRKIRRWL